MDLTCVLSAVLFIASNLLGFSYFHRFRQHHHRGNHHGNHHGDGGSSFFTNLTALDPLFIQEQWEYRQDQYFVELSAGILNAMAWMVFCIPLIQVAYWQATRHGRVALHVTVAALALGGSITELIARLMFIGATSTGNWLAKDFNLDSWMILVVDTTTNGNGGNSSTNNDDNNSNNDMIGWRVLEMIHLVTRGLLLWIDAAEWLFLSAIFTLLYLSVVQAEACHFARNWARLGLAIALLAFIDFASEVLRLKSWRTFSFVAIFISWISRLLLMPIWLLWLGKQLSRVDDIKTTNTTTTMTTSRPAAVQEMIHRGNNQQQEEEEEEVTAAVYS